MHWEGRKSTALMWSGTRREQRGVLGSDHTRLLGTETRLRRCGGVDATKQPHTHTHTAGVKECLESRFKDGLMLESDYSQLEVCSSTTLYIMARLCPLSSTHFCLFYSTVK